MNRVLPLLVSLFALALTACTPGGMAAGATPGGVKDMRFARAVIASGAVPPPEAFLVEAMFSEHDLPLNGPPCTTALCLRGAGGVAPDLDGAPRGWVQLGMSSNVDLERYRRPAANYIAVVDVSSSMGWDYGTGPTPGRLSQSLLSKVVDELNADDTFAIVTFGSWVETPLGFVRGDRHEEMHDAVDVLAEDGSTNLEAGLDRAYALAREAPNDRPVRVLLFTDVQPNVGATGDDAFEQMVADAAAEGTGTTVFAMGLGVGQELLVAMSHLRGGNAFSVIDLTDVTRVIDDSFPFLAHPIATDLTVTVNVRSDDDVAGRAFGFPASEDRDVGLEVATVFLSKKRGALLLEVAGELADGFDLAASIAYTATNGRRATETITVGHNGLGLDERGMQFAQPGVEKTTALALLVSGMREAATLYATDEATAAVARMTTVSARIAADAGALADPALDAEVALAADLLRLMQDGAPQEAFYGE